MSNYKITDAIILVGGLGTRLRPVVQDLPKPLAKIAGKAFLEYLLDILIENKIERVILALGYKHELIKEHFKNGYQNIKIEFALETKPLGTGGAIVNALKLIKNTHCLVMNGDSYCDFKLTDFFNENDLEILSHRVEDISRYGALTIENRVLKSFVEKCASGPGAINAGVYLINKKIFKDYSVGDNFSFEKDFLPAYISKQQALVCTSNSSMFIDIGTPEDFLKANNLFKNELSL